MATFAGGVGKVARPKLSVSMTAIAIGVTSIAWQAF